MTATTPVVVLFDPELLARVDILVAKRKLQEASTPVQKVTDLQRHEAHKIAMTSGVGAANAYLRKVQQRPKRVSRVSVLHSLIEQSVALAEKEMAEAALKNTEPAAAKKPRRI